MHMTQHFSPAGIIAEGQAERPRAADRTDILARLGQGDLLTLITAAMQRAKVNQGLIARETGLSGTTISRLCRGQYGHDSQALRRVLEYLDATLREQGQPGLLAPVAGEEAEDAARGAGPAPAAAGEGAGAPGPGEKGAGAGLKPAVRAGLKPAPTDPFSPDPAGPAVAAKPTALPGGRGAAVVALAPAPRPPEAPPSLAAPWGGAYCTDGQRLMWGVLRAIAADRELGLVVSLSGTGKSYCIDRFAETYPGTLVYRPLRGISQSGILEDLCRLFGVPYSGSNDTRRRRLLDGGAGRTLLIDEADLLVAGRYVSQAVDRLEIYRQLQERGCAVALVGLPALLHTVAPPSETELAAYWRAQIAGYPQAHARAGLVALAAAKHGYLRYLDKLARRTRDTDGDVGAAETLLFRGDQR